MGVKAVCLTKKFGNFVAVDCVSFDVKDGEIYGFLGANGAGKTTTIRMLCGILQPTSGDAFINSISVVKNPDTVKKMIGYMSQKFSLYNNLTVEENIKFYAGLYNLNKNTFIKNKEEIIERLILKDYLNKTLNNIPGGIKQRVALACAIIHKPYVLFLDEPTAGVDPILRQIFWDIINELAKSGITIFVTTHYMDEVEYCNRVALMNNGKLIKEGTLKELKENTFEKEVYEIETDDIVKSYRLIKDIIKEIGEVSLYGSNLHIIPNKKENIEVILNILKENNIKISNPKQVLPTMEDVFIKLIKR